eukprot:15013685-Ditylum_brightwellii.AAC.1
MAGWCGHIVDIKGAFLRGAFEDGEATYMEVPRGFESYYSSWVVLLMLQTIYNLKQSAIAYCKKAKEAFRSMKYKRNKADP